MTRLSRATLEARLDLAIAAFKRAGEHAIMRHDLHHAPPWFLL